MSELRAPKPKGVKVRGMLRRDELVLVQESERVAAKPLNEHLTAILFPAWITISLMVLAVTVVFIDHPFGAVVFLVYTAICVFKSDWIMAFLNEVVGIQKWLTERRFEPRQRWVRQSRDIPAELHLVEEDGLPVLRWRYELDKAVVLSQEPAKVTRASRQEPSKPLEDGSIALDGHHLSLTLSRSTEAQGEALLECHDRDTRGRMCVQFSGAWLDSGVEVPTLEREGVRLRRDDQARFLRKFAMLMALTGGGWPRALTAIKEDAQQDLMSEHAQPQGSPDAPTRDEMVERFSAEQFRDRLRMGQHGAEHAQAESAGIDAPQEVEVEVAAAGRSGAKRSS